MFTHYSASFRGHGHSITNFARNIAACDPDGEFHIVDPEISDTLQFPENSVVHIGNNIESLPLLLALRRTPHACIVIVHDLLIISLVDALGNYESQPRLVTKVIFEQLHGNGLRMLGSYMKGENLPVEDQLQLFRTLLQFAIPQHHSVISHYSGRIGISISQSNHWNCHSELMLPRYYRGMAALAPVEEPRWDLVTRDTRGHWKRTHVVQAAVLELMKHRTISLGIVDTPYWWSEENINLGRSFGSNIDLLGRLNDSDFDQVHSQTRIGIRLGVGEFGECSGLVRDYVSQGMITITDDQSGAFGNTPNVILVGPDCSAEYLAEVIDLALANAENYDRTLPLPASEELNFYWNQLTRVTV